MEYLMGYGRILGLATGLATGLAISLTVGGCAQATASETVTSAVKAPVPYAKPGLPVSVSATTPIIGAAGAWIPVELAVAAELDAVELAFGSSTGLQVSEASRRLDCGGPCGTQIVELAVRAEADGRHYLDVIATAPGGTRGQSVAVSIGEGKAIGAAKAGTLKVGPGGERLRAMEALETVDGVAEE